jgi:hypothetical protein
MTYFQQGREFTLEISNTKLMEPDSLPYYWQFNYRSLLNYLEQCTFGLRGTVKDSLTGWPIKAEIYAVLHEKDSSWVYSSLPNGNYNRLLYAGDYTIRFSAPGYLPAVRNNVSITNRQATILNIKLLPEGVGGIDNNQISNLIRIYPSPLYGDVLFFESDIGVEEIEIYDLIGKLIYQFNTCESSRRINLPHLNDGLYFIRFATEKGFGVKKIIINH